MLVRAALLERDGESLSHGNYLGNTGVRLWGLR